MVRNYEPKVSFHTPNTEEGGGIVSNLSELGVDLQTMQRLAVGDEVEMKIKLLLGKNPMLCTVKGTIKTTVNVAKPLHGYRIAFDSSMPTPTKLMIQKLTLDEETLKKQNAMAATIKKPVAEKEIPEDIVIDYSQDPLYRTSSRNTAEDTRKLLIAFGFVVLLFGVIKGGHFLLEKLDRSGVPSSIPIVKFEEDAGTIVMEVNKEWMLKSQEVRQGEMEELIQFLHKKNYDSAILNDTDGDRLVRVVMQQGAPPEKARIFFEK